MNKNADNRNVNFPTLFCLRIISNKFGAIEFKEVSFKGNVYDFSVDYPKRQTLVPGTSFGRRSQNVPQETFKRGQRGVVGSSVGGP